MQMAPDLYLSSSYVRGAHVREVLSLLADSGITRIELSGGIVWSDDIVPAILQMRADRGLKYQVHNYFPPDPEGIVLNVIAPDRADRRRSHEFARRSLDVAGELGLSLYSVHAGYLGGFSAGNGEEFFRRTGTDRITRREGKKILLDAVGQLADQARRRAIRLAVENLFPIGPAGEDLSMLCHPEEILWFLESFSEIGDVGLLLDLGHLHVAAELMGFAEGPFLKELVRAWKSKLFAVHISHNHGTADDHLPIPPAPTPGSPENWIFDCLEILHPIEAVVTLEIRHGTIEEVKASLATISSRLTAPAVPATSP